MCESKPPGLNHHMPMGVLRFFRSFVRTFVPHDIFNTSIHKMKQQGLNETQVRPGMAEAASTST